MRRAGGDSGPAEPGSTARLTAGAQGGSRMEKEPGAQRGRSLAHTRTHTCTRMCTHTQLVSRRAGIHTPRHPVYPRHRLQCLRYSGWKFLEYQQNENSVANELSFKSRAPLTWRASPHTPARTTWDASCPRQRGRKPGCLSAPQTREVHPAPERGRAKAAGQGATAGSRAQRACDCQPRAGLVVPRSGADTSKCLDFVQRVADLEPLSSLCRRDVPGPLDSLCCGDDLDGVPPQQERRPWDAELEFRAPDVSPTAPSCRRWARDGVHPLTVGSSLSSITGPRSWVSFPG